MQQEKNIAAAKVSRYAYGRRERNTEAKKRLFIEIMTVLHVPVGRPVPRLSIAGKRADTSAQAMVKYRL